MGSLLRRLFFRLVRWIFNTFPNQRRTVCIVALLAGFLLTVPMLSTIYTGHDGDNNPWQNLWFIMFAVGLLLAITGFGVLRAINQFGKEQERI